ncbi:MAG: hypothetical protein AAFS10_21060, partial [Myxococcota bacterium]
PRDNATLYLACDGGLVLANIANPLNPVRITQIPGENLYDVHLFGQTMYALGDASISVFGTASPGEVISRGVSMFTATPGFETLTGLRYLVGQGTWMAAASGANVLLIDRASELLNMPAPVVILPLDGNVVSLGADTGFIYAGTSQGVFRLDIQEP